MLRRVIYGECRQVLGCRVVPRRILPRDTWKPVFQRSITHVEGEELRRQFNGDIRAKLYRNDQIASSHLRQLRYSTRLNHWFRNNFGVALFLSVILFVMTISAFPTLFISVTLLSLNALFVNEWLEVLMSNIVGYTLGSEVTVGKFTPKWTENKLRITDLQITREAEFAREINGAAIDLKIKRLDVSVSFFKFFIGEGFLKEVSISGVTGTIDRTTTIWTDEMEAEYQKRKPKKGDFHLENVKVKNVDVVIYQDFPSRPLQLTIFSIKFPRLRENWLLLDILGAEAGHGKFDGCLFSIENISVDYVNQARLNRFKITGLNFDLINSSYSTGVLSWITQGFMDIDCYFKFPVYILDKRIEQFEDISKIPYNVPFDMALSLNNINISLPKVTSDDITFSNYAVTQPIVAYFNTNYVKIPLDLKFQVNMNEFSGSWYPGDAGLYDSVSNASYDEIVRLIREQTKYRRLRELIALGANGCYRGAKYYFSQTWSYIKEHV